MPWIHFSLDRPTPDDVLSQKPSATSDLAPVSVILGEMAVQAQIVAAGGAAEGIATGLATTGLTAGSVGFMLAGSLSAGVTIGNAARNHLIPENANRWYGDKLLTATDFWGVTGGITRAQHFWYSVGH